MVTSTINLQIKSGELIIMAKENAVMDEKQTLEDVLPESCVFVEL